MEVLFFQNDIQQNQFYSASTRDRVRIRNRFLKDLF